MLSKNAFQKNVAVVLIFIYVLDEDYFFFLEETDWCLRARQKGWKVVFHPRLYVYHLQGKSAAKVLIPARIEYWRSRYTFFRKHYGSITGAWLYCGLLARLVVNLIFTFLLSIYPGKSRQRLTVYTRLLLWHLRGRPEDGGLKPSRTKSALQ